MNIIQTIAKILVAPTIFLLGLAGYKFNPPAIVVRAPIHQAPDYSLDISHLKSRVSSLETSKNQNLGASSILPTTIALFSTSLQSAITSGATSMTLVSATYNNGASTLASSTYAFIIDEGTVSQEFVIADCTGTTCTNMTRGLSFLDGKTSVLSLEFAHRRGASVKITDAPILLLLSGFLNNTIGIPAPISYDTSVATTSFNNGFNLIDKSYVDSIAIAGASIINATTGARGIVQLATGAQAGSTTQTGSSGANLVLQAGLATSTCQSTGNYAVITDNNGKINTNCFGAFTLSNSTLIGTSTFSSTATSSTIFTATSSVKVGASSVYDIGKHEAVYAANGTYTWNVPTGTTRVFVRLVGAGGGAGNGSGANNTGGGGGAGGYSEGPVDLTATTSAIQLIVGVGGTGGNPGTSGGKTSFGGVITATGGTGGALGASSGGSGGAGTSNSLGSMNQLGGAGQGGFTTSGGSGGQIGALGGASAFGGTGANGSGGASTFNSSGQNAQDGIIIITW